MIRVDIRVPLNYDEGTIRCAIENCLGVAPDEAQPLRLLRRTIVAEDVSNIHYKLSVVYPTVFPQEGEATAAQRHKP